MAIRTAENSDEESHNVVYTQEPAAQPAPGPDEYAEASGSDLEELHDDAEDVQDAQEELAEASSENDREEAQEELEEAQEDYDEQYEETFDD